MGLLRRIFGDANQRIIARLQKRVQRINALEPEFRRLDDEALRAKTEEFRRRLASGETLDDILEEAFAAVREAGRRTIGLRHYDVQLIGGMLLHQGNVVEMRTGEGKTLVATLPLYLNALAGHGAHLVTPNDYLAKFGAQWMGPIYAALGVSVGVIQSGAGMPDEASFLYDPDYVSDDDRYQYLRPITRRQAYACEITYGTNNEFGFDYLRDNMVIDLSQCVQRELHYAIVDEVDSILIDEARTPLIISGPADEPSELYGRFARLVRQLQKDVDYEVEARSQVVILTDEGIAKVERALNIPEGESIYDSEHAEVLPYLDNALRAKEFYHLDKQYVVRDGEIVIVDEFTGRLMFGRRYSEGLHQAIEAKEGVTIRRESLTYATITYQNFFRMYHKLAGMTGTAATEKEELHKIYGLDVVVLPTNVEYRARFGDLKEREVPIEASGVQFAGLFTEADEDRRKVTVFDGPEGERFYRRLDLPDRIYKTEQAKFKAVIQEIQRLHQAGRPVLVGTTAIETSEHLSRLLKRRHIPHNVLNAKYHEQEAVIIAQAGRPGAVTIATNMAGRGVDILLGGNPEGLAREQLRKEGVDLTQIRSAVWEEALKLARAGEDPTAVYPERWAEVLRDKVQQCRADRRRVYELGGLHVIGTERHEARRIDNQLRGRAGRQGDPGSSRFYISLEDELMRRFGGERLRPWMERAGLDEAPLEFGPLNKVLASIQERVEGYNFDIRKHVLEYDNVVNKQREVIYAERRKILSREDLREDLMQVMRQELHRVVGEHFTEDETWDVEGMVAELLRFVPVPADFKRWLRETPEAEEEEIVARLMEVVEREYERQRREAGYALYQNLRQSELSLRSLEESDDPFSRTLAARMKAALGEEADWYDLPLRRMPNEAAKVMESIVLEVSRLYQDRHIMLRQLDEHWRRHLTNLDVLREGIGLRAYGQQNPLVAYQKEAYEMYQEMLASVQREIARSLLATRPARPQQRAGGGRAARRPQLRTNRQGQPAPATRASRASGRSRRLGRNDPCWCGSGKKYKDCHLREDRQKGIVRYVRVQEPSRGRAGNERKKRSRRRHH